MRGLWPLAVCGVLRARRPHMGDRGGRSAAHRDIVLSLAIPFDIFAPLGAGKVGALRVPSSI